MRVAFTKLQVGLFAAQTSAIEFSHSARPKPALVCNAAIDVGATTQKTRII